MLNKLTKYTYYRDGCAVAHSKTLINTGVSKDLPRNQAKKTEAPQVAVKFFGNADKQWASAMLGLVSTGNIEVTWR